MKRIISSLVLCFCFSLGVFAQDDTNSGVVVTSVRVVRPMAIMTENSLINEDLSTLNAGSSCLIMPGGRVYRYIKQKQERFMYFRRTAKEGCPSGAIFNMSSATYYQMVKNYLVYLGKFKKSLEKEN
jgi:hypothetical protein